MKKSFKYLENNYVIINGTITFSGQCYILS